jgi:serine/threonine-protein kinase RsbT
MDRLELTSASESYRVRVRTEGDAAEAARIARELGLRHGLSRAEAVQVATAVSEIAANQVRHARDGGTLTLSSAPAGVVVEATDAGPGIADVDLALRDGWSSDGGLGLGLPGARRLVDRFEIESRRGSGTVVRMAKLVGSEPGPLGVWAISGRSQPGAAGVEAVTEATATSLLLGIMGGVDAARSRADPAAAASDPAGALAGGRGVVASLSGRDGHVSWLSRGAAGALVLRGAGDGRRAVGSAPARRAAELRVLREDVLLLCSTRPDPDRARPAELAAMAAQAADETGGVAIAARVLRGVLERPDRRR